MSEKKQLKKIMLICHSEREKILKEKLAPIVSEYEWIDISSIASYSQLQEKISDKNSIILMDLDSISAQEFAFEENWLGSDILLIGGSSQDVAAAAWKNNFSFLCLESQDFLLALELGINQEKFPGIFALAEEGSEIYFEKVQSLREIGAKMDRFVALLGQKYPALTPQFYNLRQLSYAVLHEAYGASTAAGKATAVVDFQITSDGKRIALAARFNAAPGSLAEWRDAMATSRSSPWHHARLSADLIVFTELNKILQMEIKALICQDGDFAADQTNSLLARSIPDFEPDATSLKKQKSARFFSMGELPAPAGIPAEKLAHTMEGAVVSTNSLGTNNLAAEMDAEEPAGSGLNFKLKADMLENEKNNLQGMVKKKSQLISGLTKDVNRAQQEVIAAQKNATKEILKMRMETEKAKNLARDANKRMAAMQRRLEEKEASSKVAQDSGEQNKDIEKEWKKSEQMRGVADQKLAELNVKTTKLEELLQKQRKDNGELNATINELKLQNIKLEQALAQKLKDEKSALVFDEKAGSEGDDPQSRAKEMKKLYSDAKNKEVELDKEVKRLTIKSEAAEKNLKVHIAAAQKQLESAEKSAEDAKRQKTEAAKKLEDMRAEIKKKVEENNSNERLLKKKADDLAEALRIKNLEFEKINKQLIELKAAGAAIPVSDKTKKVA